MRKGLLFLLIAVLAAGVFWQLQSSAQSAAGLSPSDEEHQATEVERRELPEFEGDHREAKSDSESDPEAVASTVPDFEHPSTSLETTDEGYEYVHVRIHAPNGRPFFDVLDDLKPESVPMFTSISCEDRMREVGIELLSVGFEGSPFHPDQEIAQFATGGEFHFQFKVERDWVFLAASIWGRVAACEPLPPKAKELTLVIDPFSILAERSELHARFLNEKSEPLHGNVNIKWTLPRPTSRRAYIVERSLSTSETGVFHYQGLTPGQVDVVAQFNGLPERLIRTELIAGQRTDLGTIILKGNTSIRGKLVAEGSVGVNRTLRLYRPDDPAHVAEIHSDEQGAFLFARLSPAEYFLIVHDDFDQRHRSWQVSETRAARPEPQRLVTEMIPVSTVLGDVEDLRVPFVEPAEVALRVIFNPGVKIDCQLINLQGQVVKRGQADPVDGRLHWWVAPGPYDVTWSRGGEELGRRSIQTSHERLWVEIFEE